MFDENKLLFSWISNFQILIVLISEPDNTSRDMVSAFILTAKSDNLLLRTARPPDPPSNLGILASTCSSLKVAWDPPREHGVDVIGTWIS